MEILLSKSMSGSLVPAYPEEAEKLESMRPGEVCKAKITRPRNLRFHRKGMALLGLAYSMWSEGLPTGVDYKGETVAPNFDRFRKDLTILAGFYEPIYGIDGSTRLTAKSLSFASMKEDEFERVYSALINTILGKVLKSLKAEELDAAVERVMRFA